MKKKTKKPKKEMNYFEREANRPYSELDPDMVLYYLANGSRKPQSQRERNWLKSIEKTKAKGYGIEYPFN